jgi:ribosomal protein S18 acetylase RimI-like enzyme
MASSGHLVDTTMLADRLEALRQERGTALLALEWGPPSGLIVLSWFRTLHADHPVGQITTLLVAPGDRRRGIGRMLLKAGAQSARSAGCNELFLLAPSDQLGLAEFSRANGFDEAGSRFSRPLRKRT